jgi:hypothetical protein
MTETTPPAGAFTLHLGYPITYEGEGIASLTLRRPTGGDIRRMQSATGNDVDRSFKLMSDLAERPIEVIDLLDPTDLEKINDWLEPILDPKARQAKSKT